MHAHAHSRITTSIKFWGPRIPNFIMILGTPSEGGVWAWRICPARPPTPPLRLDCIFEHMAVVRAWPSISRAVTTVWRIGRRTPPTLYRSLWCGAKFCRQDTPLIAGAGSLGEHGNGQPFSELTSDFQILSVLVDTLKQSSGKADIYLGIILSKNTPL